MTPWLKGPMVLRPVLALNVLVLAPVCVGWMTGAPLGPTLPIQLWEGSLSRTTRYLPEEERAAAFQALQLATKVHHGQKRCDGSPFVTHPVAVANIVATWGMDKDCVCAALLHDAVEDTPLTFGEVEEQFGEEVRSLVQGVTRISKLPDDKLAELEMMGMDALCQDSGDLLQLLDACAGDWRVAVLKVADRLHNMRTLSAMKPHKRAWKAQETEHVFVPLAHYLGAHEVGTELAALARRHHADDQPQHRLWAGRLRSAMLTPRLQQAAAALGLDAGALEAVRPRAPIGDSTQFRRLVLQLDDADDDRARNLVMRLRPLHERFSRHRMWAMQMGMCEADGSS